MPSESQAQALQELLETNLPIVVLQTHDEKRVLTLAEAVARRTRRALWAWSASSGLRALHGLKLRLVDQGAEGHPGAADTLELPAALKAVGKLDGPALVLLLDLHPYLNHPVTVRALKDLALASERTQVQLVFVAHALSMPEELQPWAAAFEIEPMTPARVSTVLREEITRQRARSGHDVAGCQRTLESLQRHLTGLPEASVRHLARLALGDGQVTAADLARVLAAKQSALGAAELLVFEAELPAMDEVAGMAALKRWLHLRRAPFLEPAAAQGLPPPRGVLLLGVQGAGKSLAAKAVAASWQLPLFRMDFGALHDKWQGESERKLREALRVAESMQPCVLWMDEIEKGLAGGGADDGTGATRRMLGTLLTWMAERRSHVFLVATANDIQALPPELVRKGRFDEIFFIDLPDDSARAELMHIHLGRLKIAFDDSALATLVVASIGFSGAEIQSAAVATRYEALALGREATAASMLAELARTRPLSVTRAEAVGALRAWAAERAVPAG
jgi:hypothetical protein